MILVSNRGIDVVVITRLIVGGLVFTVPIPPVNLFNIGDSIGEGEAANGTFGQAHQENVWSSGYDDADGVNVFNERYETLALDGYYESNAGRDQVFNRAVSGTVIAEKSLAARETLITLCAEPVDLRFVRCFPWSNERIVLHEPAIAFPVAAARQAAKECRFVTRHYGNQYENKKNYSETLLSFDDCQNVGICDEYAFNKTFLKQRTSCNVCKRK